ncbi:tetratricopeptide repeat protein [Janthinobacterium kumbetense]|uniref:protein O-GlcNAc transferase n=1 Tax=Janthinobacterium kumbetense TaxID=2950280 RepID=A0ABT0WMQ8_9BURK|nr:tetratricopeptide repeat protein [Janthinobacterium kumbetense]MCM2565340.1 tetratricopeptide repeat protein [Janthinobacterium kumbetense]
MHPTLPPAVSPDTELQQAIAEHQAGRFAEAEEIYLSILQAHPYHAIANHNLGLLAGQVGQHVAGLPYLRKALSVAPDEGQFWLSYAQGLLQAGQPDEALDIVDTAIGRGLDNDASQALRRQAQEAVALAALSPSQPEMDHIVQLYQAGQHAQMEAACRQLLASYPDSPFGWSVLGTALQLQGKDALATLQRTVELTPHDAQAHGHLGNAWQTAGKLDAARDCYLRALEIEPAFAEAHCNLGNLLQAENRLDEAVASYRRALALKPDYALAAFNLGNALLRQKQFGAAADSFRAATLALPDDAEAHNRLGQALHENKNVQDAVRSFQRALQIKPDYRAARNNLVAAYLALKQYQDVLTCLNTAMESEPDDEELHFHLGNVMRTMGKSKEALAAFQRALEIKPDYAAAEINLCSLLHAEGHLEEAIASGYRARTVAPHIPESHSGLLFCLSHSIDIDAQRLFEEHCRFGDAFDHPSTAGTAEGQGFHNDNNPARRIRVGFVSGDFNSHVVSNFVVPVIAHLSASPGLSLYAYYNNTLEDAVTQRLRGYFPHWQNIIEVSDSNLQEKVREDGIDILVDLSSHTAFNRLTAFGRKLAPIQVSWIAYPGTTGLKTMDYYLTDPQFDVDEKYFTEKVVLLPASVPFLPSSDSPELVRAPALGNGYLTFGSFNRLSKLNPGVIARWAKLLRALPEAKMHLAAMQKDSDIATLQAWFAQEGIAADRLTFHGRTHLGGYLALHQQIDLCLDTFPYTGGTTTLHALWMGVPTLTLKGTSVPSHAGACILQHVGLDAFIATDDDDFVRKGIFLSNNIMQLAVLRADLRNRMQESALADSRAIAHNMEQAFRTMWQRWCGGLPPASFAIAPDDASKQAVQS